MFVLPPSGFPKLEALAKMSEGALPPPKKLEGIGERVYQACVGRTVADMPELGSRIKRWIPYAMWLDSKRDIHTEKQVVSWYYDNLRALKPENTLHTKRRLAPLLHTYVNRFNPALPAFHDLAANLQAAAKRCDNGNLSVLSLGTLDHRFDLFNPAKVGSIVAQEFLEPRNHATTFHAWLESIGLWPEAAKEPLGLHIYECALQLPTHRYKNMHTVAALMNWTMSMGGRNLAIELKALLGEAMLKPWIDSDPPEDAKRAIGDFCIEILGDPRNENTGNPRSNAFTWTRVRPAAKDVLLRWLTGRTLEIFFEVLRNTADEIWEHRQNFWTPYYRKGYITEAWAVLGPHAHRYMRARHRGSDLIYGRLAGATDEGQSVLLMRMGDFLFCEWSHNGKLRVTTIGTLIAPPMYKNSYDASDLRFDSMPFVDSAIGAEHFGLPHLHSETQWWQNTAAAFIHRKLGIHR